MQDNLIKHGAIVFAGASVANVLNYLFQLIMARLLTPIDYGVLIALFALFSIFVTGASAVSAISTKVSVALKASGEFGKLKHFLMAYIKIILFFSAAVIVLVFFASGQIAVFLNINSTMLVLILFLAGCFSYFNSLLTGTLSGLQRFFSFAGMNASGAAGKFVLGMLLVLFGFGVGGALVGLVLGLALETALGFVLLRGIFRAKTIGFKVSKTFSYSCWVIVAFICLAVLSNIDVVLVKHFFSGEEAGIYSAIATVAKIIFYATSALAIVLLPKAAAAHALNKNPSRVLLKAIALMALVCIPLTAAYFLLPQLAIDIIVSSKYVAGAPLLGLIAVSVCLFSFSNLLAVYYVSIHRKKFALLLLLFSALEIASIYAFHGTLMQVVITLIWVQFALLLVMSGYYFVDLKVSRFELN